VQEEMTSIENDHAAMRASATPRGDLDATEVVEETPREGTLAWLQLQEHVEWEGLEIPGCHRIAEGSRLHPETTGICRVVRPNGERCRAPATRRYGLCVVHVGGGGTLDAAMAARANAAKTRLKATRVLLGIGPKRAADPRQIARLAAAARADEIAAGLLAPLDDADLSSMAKQAASQRILDATFPIQTVEVEVTLPGSADEVGSLSWQQMQQLAAQLLGTQPVPNELEAA